MIKYGLSESDISKINTVFAEYQSIEAVILYGSRAKGTFKKGSDIDLTIISNSLSFTELLSIENQLDDLLLPYKMDISIKSQITNPNLIEHIARVGVVFYKNTYVNK